MNDVRTLADIQAICKQGAVVAVWHPSMLKRMAALSKISLAEAKRIVRRRFGTDCAPQSLARAIREERDNLLRAERAKSFSSKAESDSGEKLTGRKDTLMALFGRRGGMTRCPKGIAGMSPETAARVRAAALAGRQRARAEREAAGLGRNQREESPPAPAERLRQDPLNHAPVIVLGW